MTYNRRRLIKTIGAAGAVGLAGCAGNGNGNGGNGNGNGNGNGGGNGGAAVPEDWSFGITREGTIGYVKASGWASVFENADTHISLSLNTTGGSEEAFRLCARGDNEITRGTSSMGVASYESSGRPGADFSGDNAVPTVPQQIMAVTDLRPFIITMNDDVQTISDLEGMDVHGGAAGSYFMGALPLDTLGLLENVNLQSGDWSDVPFALEEGRVDAAFTYTMGLGTSLPGWAEQMSDWDELRILDYSDDEIDLLSEDPFLQLQDVQVSDVFRFDTNIDTTTSAAHPYQWYVHEDVSADSVYEFLEVTFDNLETLNNHHDALEILTEEYAFDSMTRGAPVHSGAIQWFADNGFEDDDLIEG